MAVNEKAHPIKRVRPLFEICIIIIIIIIIFLTYLILKFANYARFLRKQSIKQANHIIGGRYNIAATMICK